MEASSKKGYPAEPGQTVIPHWTFEDERRIRTWWWTSGINDEIEDSRMEEKKRWKEIKEEREKKEAEREGDREAGWSLSYIAAAHQKP